MSIGSAMHLFPLAALCNTPCSFPATIRAIYATHPTLPRARRKVMAFVLPARVQQDGAAPIVAPLFLSPAAGAIGVHARHHVEEVHEAAAVIILPHPEAALHAQARRSRHATPMRVHPLLQSLAAGATLARARPPKTAAHKRAHAPIQHLPTVAPIAVAQARKHATPMRVAPMQQLRQPVDQTLVLTAFLSNRPQAQTEAQLPRKLLSSR